MVHLLAAGIHLSGLAAGGPITVAGPVGAPPWQFWAGIGMVVLIIYSARRGK
jgi:hypothetical protein